MDQIKPGDFLHNKLACEDYIVLALLPNGFLSIQLKAYFNANMKCGIEIIPDIDVDGIQIVHYPNSIDITK